MLPRPGWYSYWSPSLIVSTIDLHATLPITKIFPPTVKMCHNCCKDVDCNFDGADKQIWLCDCKYCVNCNLIYTECICPPQILSTNPTDLLMAERHGLTRKLLGIDPNGQEILESDADFRQRIKATYDSTR